MENSKIAEAAKQIFTDYLKENRCRRTPERFAILEAVYSINGCFDIDEILRHMEEEEKFRVSRATVYNTISLLQNANLVVHHQFGNVSKYEKCYGTEKSHMVCTNCGKVTEIGNLNITETILILRIPSPSQDGCNNRDLLKDEFHNEWFSSP